MPTSVLTHHNDPARTGANLTETVLDTHNVNPGQFGLLFRRQVDGEIYAQPLYVPALNFGAGGIHNVVFVATMHNTVFAFDADDPKASQPLWSRAIGGSISLPDPEIGQGLIKGDWKSYANIAIEVGIVSTPVISLQHNLIYVVAARKDPTGYSHVLHAFNLTTGAEPHGSVTIRGSVKGTGPDNQNGIINFDSRRQNQRAGLLLLDDTIYIAFASYADRDYYHGWVFAYSANDLSKVAAPFNSTPDGTEGGIWQAGQGLAADNNSIYFMTGNGSFNMYQNGKFNPGGRNLGDAFVRLNKDLTLADWFAPFNNSALDANDLDLGSAGPLIIPNTQLMVGGGKEGKLYLLDRSQMGKFNPTTDQIVQPPFQATEAEFVWHHIHGGPVFWQGPTDKLLYVWGEQSYLTSFRFVNGKFDPNPFQRSSFTGGLPPLPPTNLLRPFMPGGFLSLSANGAAVGSGVVWATHNFDKDAMACVVDGILHAFNAEDLSCELWNSKMVPTRDDLGLFAKFCPPTVAEGKVFAATFSNSLAVYGLLANHDPLVGELCKKLVLADTCLTAPALGNLNDTALALAFVGTDIGHHLNVELFNAQMAFLGKKTLSEASLSTPSLAGAFGQLFIAWTGEDIQHRVNLMSSVDGLTFGGKVTLQETSPYSPALAAGIGKLFVAWVGSDLKRSLNVMSSNDGKTFSNKVTLSETSTGDPGLAFANNTLYLLWRGDDPQHRLNIMESADGSAFGNKQVLPESSNHHPALAGISKTMYLTWTGVDLPSSINVSTSRAGTAGFGEKRTFGESSAAAPALVQFKQNGYLAWTGVDVGRHLNLARLV